MKKIQKIFLLGLIICCCLILLVIFQPAFIKETPFANVLDNDNLNNFLVLIDIVITISLILYQDYDTRKSVFMKFRAVSAEYTPGGDGFYGVSHLVCRIIPPSMSTVVYDIQAFRDQSPQKSCIIPIEATLKTEVDIIAITLSGLKISYKTNGGYNKTLELSNDFDGDFLIHREALQSGDKILLYFSLWLSTELNNEIIDGGIVITFTEKFTNKYKQTIHKTVTMQIIMDMNGVQVIEQY